jgi:isoleucyl-tRNA synthetase
LWAVDKRQPDQAQARWASVTETRDRVLLDLEKARAAGLIGSSLQAEIILRANAADIDALAAFGEELKYLLIVSK